MPPNNWNFTRAIFAIFVVGATAGLFATNALAVSDYQGLYRWIRRDSRSGIRLAHT
jgi:hypothetical protein